MNDVFDATIIGAGPAGSTTAALLRQNGWSVRVLERTRFPRFVIGESLLPRCMDTLEAAGTLAAVERKGYIVKRGATFLQDGERCTYDFSEQFTRGWSWTWQVPRASFDDVLASEARRVGADLHFEAEVTAVDVGDEPVVVWRDANGREQRTRTSFVVDASGYGRVLPRLLALDAPSRLQERAAVFTHVDGDRRPAGDEAGRIWVVIHEDAAWIWVIPFHDGRTSIGVVATPDFLARYPSDGEQCLRAVIDGAPGVRERLADMQVVMPPQRIQGYSCRVTQMHGPGYCMVGNATEFLDPVFSSGVTLALESARLAAGCVDAELRGDRPDWARDFEAPMKLGTDVFRTFVEAWYRGDLPRIFFNAEKAPNIKRMICSVLAGYVWDEENPFVAQHDRKIRQLIRLLDSGASLPESR
jgi:flavin-dependent dehydrogenase